MKTIKFLTAGETLTDLTGMGHYDFQIVVNTDNEVLIAESETSL